MKATTQPQRRESAQRERIAKLSKKKLPVAWETLQEPFRGWCMRDFISTERVIPKTSMTEVQNRICALSRVQEVVGEWRSMEKAEKLGMRLDSKDLLLKFAGCVLKRAVERRRLQQDFSGVEKMLDDFLEKQAAFRAVMESVKAVGHEEAYVKELLQTPPGSLRARIDAFVPLDRIVALRLALDRRGIMLAEIKGHEEFKIRLRRFEDYPEHPNITPEATAEAIARFLSPEETSVVRQKRLLDEFDDFDVEYRDDSFFTSDYIKKKVDVDAEEVAAVMWATKEQFKEAPNGWAFRDCHDEVEAVMEKRRFEKPGISWREAAALAIGKVLGSWQERHKGVFYGVISHNLHDSSGYDSEGHELDDDWEDYDDDGSVGFGFNRRDIGEYRFGDSCRFQLYD